MQKTIITLLSGVTFALILVCAAQWRQLRVAHARLQAVEAAQHAEAETREVQSTKLKELERANQRLDQQVREFTTVTTTLRTKEATQSSNLTALASHLGASPAVDTPDTKPGLGKELGNMVQNMMKDPAMREMMRGQQQSAIKMMYNGLFKELKVTPEEKDKLMSILTDLQMKTLENAQGIFGDAPDSADTAAQGNTIADVKQQADAAIKDLLGEERNQQFKDYQSQIGERMQIDQLQTRLQTGNSPLQDDQAAQLLEAMKLEKAVTPAPIPSDANENPAALKNVVTSENIDKQIQWMTGYNQRVLDRASQFLTPEQLKSYRELQEQQAAMQQMGLKMAKEMFGTGKAAAPAPVRGN